jgi:chemotaxis protein MotB
LTRASKKVQESSSKVPAYIVTFSDMVTLLLTFFVMLLSLANVQDKEMFNLTQNAFVEHINTFGLGMLMGKKMSPDLGKAKYVYYITDPDINSDVRTIDGNEENIRRIFKKVTESMEAMPSQIVAQRTDFTVTNISFAPGRALLNESAEKYLTQFALNLQPNAGPEKIKLYVLGLADDARTEKAQWILSARRGQVVADFLNDVLPLQLQCPVYSWGAGPGGHWVSRDSSGHEGSDILIAVLRGND